MEKNIFNRTVKTNIIIYPTDGSGRDCYITYNNAGFWKDNIKRITLKEKFKRKPFVSFHSLKRIPPLWNYHADGTGRDGYILYDCGGLMHRYHSPNNYLFRSNDEDVMSNNHYRNTFLSKDERIYKNKLTKIQNDLLQRLYYKPKREFKFLHKDNSAPNIFNKRKLEPIKKRNEINYENGQNINYAFNERYNLGTLDKRFDSKSKIRNALFNEKNNNEENASNPKGFYKFKNFQKYRVKSLSNSIDDKAYNYPFNQFSYKKK